MKRNIYQKLHDACLSATGVKKGAKVNGMHFSPLLHDDVQVVATQALLDNGLYATCNYLTEIVPNIKKVMVVCTMRVYDVMIQRNIYLLMVVHHSEILVCLELDKLCHTQESMRS